MEAATIRRAPVRFDQRTCAAKAQGRSLAARLIVHVLVTHEQAGMHAVSEVFLR